ncbi:MAG: preprotein translocase subunit SecG [Rhodospirillales bacterium]|nr:preprotein translocase subunit SecG [Rhodospirillales bacterium]
MTTVLTVIHLLVAIALVGVVLIQRSEGGGLGMGGSSGGMGGFMSARGTANLLTRTTGILAAAFMATSIALAILAGGHSKRVADPLAGPMPVPAAPAAPAAPATPAPPVAR